ncbi:hypothetical protein F5141DRAFT_1293964 [Pisolithus sp. B1]|nr:hypothetical protein F5141DRAFT_1293964 [Pisolithus sp. B1]
MPAGHGTIDLPYQTLAYAIFSMPVAAIGETTHYQIRKGPEAQYNAPIQSAMKKAKKDTQGLEKKRSKAEAEENEAHERQEKCEKQLEESKKVVLAEDLSLTTPIKSKIAHLANYRDKRDKRHLAATNLWIDYWKVLGPAPGGDDAFTNKLNEQSDPSILADNLPSRFTLVKPHLACFDYELPFFLRSCSTYAGTRRDRSHPSSVSYRRKLRVVPALFKLDYYGQPAFLTQSSQLYLETRLPSLGDVFCIQESFLRLRTAIRCCHLSEYIHLEAELAFVDFDDLSRTIICESVDKLLANPATVALVKTLNPNFIAPARPFKRMSYLEAIAVARTNTAILHEAEDAEGNTIKDADWKTRHGPSTLSETILQKLRSGKMADIIGQPIFLYAFPAGTQGVLYEEDAQ